VIVIRLGQRVVFRCGLGWSVVLLVCLFASVNAVAQFSTGIAGAASGAVGAVGMMNGGGMDGSYAQLEFAEMAMEKQKQDAAKRKEDQDKLIAAGSVSALDLAAPPAAMTEFNNARDMLAKDKPEEAIKHLLKALNIYPKFVSAEDALGFAYAEMDQVQEAKNHLQAAIKLDDKFARPYSQLGRLELGQKDYQAAEDNLTKAAALRPKDVDILTTLAYAQNQNHDFNHVIETAQRVHSLEHKGSANVHYLAADAAISLKDYSTAERELGLFLNEDPTNAMAPGARYNLGVLEKNKLAANQKPALPGQQPNVSDTRQTTIQTFPNSQWLHSQLLTLNQEAEDDCRDCPALSAVNNAPPRPGDIGSVTYTGKQYTLRKVVDEVAVSFSVTHGGHMVSDLDASDIRVMDDNKPPAKIVEFLPGSKLPLRLGLLVDLSGSVQKRFDFEKAAAAQFIKMILQKDSDLAFVGGFATKPEVTQDFSGDREELSKGIETLKTSDKATALFDAISYACWKLASYPEKQHVARVLVILTDGQDNDSSRTLRQAVRDAETTGVTIYTISTVERDPNRARSDADEVLSALADRSGGEAMFPNDMTQLTKTFSQLSELIRSRYMVAYKPADFEANGHYRTIRIVALKKGTKMQVHARKGYHAQVEAPAQ